jgi:hypothetical protein
MSKTIKTVQIAFNLEDPFQKKLYEYALKQAKNMSSYGRSLIQRDMDMKWVNNSVVIDHAKDEIKIEKDILKSFI